MVRIVFMVTILLWAVTITMLGIAAHNGRERKQIELEKDIRALLKRSEGEEKRIAEALKIEHERARVERLEIKNDLDKKYQRIIKSLHSIDRKLKQ